MPLIAPEPPRQADESVRSTFHTIVQTGKLKLPSLRNATGRLSLAEPHQIFSLGLNDLVAGKGLEAAKPTGWRYLVQEDDKVLAAAETLAGESNAEHVFSSFNDSRFVASTAEAIRTARALPEVGEGTFELRLLRVPALYVEAVWIYGPRGDSDLLIPLDPSPVSVATGQAIPAARLLEELRSKAALASGVGPADRTGG
jgi:hypothetical protein